MEIEVTFLILLIITSGVAMLTKKINLPYTIVLVSVGLILGYLKLINAPHLSKDMLYYIFLPPLIFQTAIHLQFGDLKRDFPVILTLVIPGVILSTIVTGYVFLGIGEDIFKQNLDLSVGLLFGAAVAATDPVAVISVFEKLGVPRRLRFLVDSESLLNDGTSIVIFTIVLELINHKLSSINFAVIDFFFVVGVGLLVGYFIGLITDEIIKRAEDPMVVITLTTVAAYLSFIIADKIGVSGVMSTVAAGLVIGQRSLLNPVYPTIKLTTETFWDYSAFLANSLIFLIIGFSINLDLLYKFWPLVLIAYVAMMVARFIVVFFTWGAFFKTSYKFPFSWSVVMGWGGIRGALTMVLALSLPDSFKYKEVIVTMVFGVVLLSIFIQGITIPFLIKFFKLNISNEEIFKFEELKTKISMVQHIINELNEMKNKMLITDKVYNELLNEYRTALNNLNNKMQNFSFSSEEIKNEEMLKLKRELLMKQKQYLIDLYHSGAISRKVYKKISDELDAELFEIENMGI